MGYGYSGRILRVDLSRQNVSIEEPEESFYRRYLGGTGFISYYLLKELEPGIDPLDSNNKLIFACGVVTGVPLPGCGRNSVGAKSPLTEIYGEGEVGGFWGAELKHAGFDAIIVEGKAAQPVYIWVRDGEASIRGAGHLWGKSVLESQELIRSELGDSLIRTAQIGLAGENLVRFACVVNDVRNVAGRTGLGAVMGSKNLKAIAVRGHQRVDLADPEKVQSMAKWLSRNIGELAPTLHELGTGMTEASALAGNLPINNFGVYEFPNARNLDARTIKETVRIGMEGCYACSVRCKKVVKIDKGPWKVNPAYGGPEYETLAALGSDCGIDDLRAVCKAHELCNAYSLDTISTGATIAFAMECFEEGLLTKKDTDGIELTFGNAQAMVEMVGKIAKREGIGDLLAEGSRQAAQRISRGAERFAIQVKGLEVPAHDPRLKPALGMGYAVASVGADHGCNIHDTLYDQEGPNIDKVKALGILGPVPRKDLGPDKVRLFTYFTNAWPGLNNCLVMCDFLPYSYDQKVEIVRAVTGWNTSLWELVKVAERATTMARAFNVREGLTSDDDRIPDRFFQLVESGPLAGTKLDPEQFKSAVRMYYSMMGWDGESSVPTLNRLRELGIEWVAEEM